MYTLWASPRFREDLHMPLYLEPKAAVAIKQPPPPPPPPLGVGAGSGLVRPVQGPEGSTMIPFAVPSASP